MPKIVLLSLSILFSFGAFALEDFRGVRFGEKFGKEAYKTLGLNKDYIVQVGDRTDGGLTYIFDAKGGVEFQGQKRVTVLYLGPKESFVMIMIMVGSFDPDLYKDLKKALSEK